MLPWVYFANNVAGQRLPGCKEPRWRDAGCARLGQAWQPTIAASFLILAQNTEVFIPKRCCFSAKCWNKGAEGYAAYLIIAARTAPQEK